MTIYASSPCFYLLFGLRRSQDRRENKSTGQESGKTFISADSYLHLHHMDGVPAPFDLLGSIPSLLDENNSSEAVIQVPKVHRGHTTLKVP